MTSSLQDHADALLDLARAQPGLTVYPVADGETGSGTGLVPRGAEPPYVSIHLAADRTAGETLELRSTRVVARAYAHCVGANPTAARAVADQLAAAWLDVRPTVPARACWPIRHEGDQPPRTDETTGRPVVDIVSVYRLESLPGDA